MARVFTGQHRFENDPGSPASAKGTRRSEDGSWSYLRLYLL